MSKSVTATIGLAGLPPEITDDPVELRKAIRAGIEAAVRAGLAPDLSVPAPAHKQAVMTHLNAAEWAYLVGLIQIQRVQIPMAAAVGRLAEAGMRIVTLAVKKPRPGVDRLGQALALAGLPCDGRPEQRALYENIAAALEDVPPVRPIVAAQAATGSGKTFVAQAIAMEYVGASKSGVVVVAFPTLHGVKAFAEQWHRCLALSKGSMPALRLLFGRSEYVSEHAVMEQIAEAVAHGMPARAESLRDWVRDQQRRGDSELVPAWMMDSLIRVDESVDKDMVAINPSTPPTDSGVRAYAQQFIGAAGARVIACSHAMLAVDVLMRWHEMFSKTEFKTARQELISSYLSASGKASRVAGKEKGEFVGSLTELVAQAFIEHEMSMAVDGVPLQSRRLPTYQNLIIDEAHQLEQSFSSIFSRTLSLMVTLRLLERLQHCAWHGAKAALSRSANVVREAIDAICQGRADGGETSLREGSQVAVEIKLRLDAMLASCLEIKPPPEASSAEALSLWSRLMMDVRTMRQALTGTGGGQCLMSFTPVRRYPHLVVGSGDVRQPLGILWSGVETAVLLSATIYMRRETDWSARYCASLLAIPPGRLRELPVVEGGWLYAPVTALYLPEGVPRKSGKGRWLRPPTRSDKLSTGEAPRVKAIWERELVDVLTWIYQSGAGGCLVLCTSLEQVSSLGAGLTAVLGPSGNVLVSTKMPSLHAMRARALDLAVAGQRSILVATGAGWTGFDVSGQARGIAPAADNVITDLAITKLPFGMNRSLTHRTRTEDPRDPVPHELLATALMLRQGLGRLVRTEGLPRNRRIFLLDGRCSDPGFDSFLAPCRRVWSMYPLKQLASDVTER